MIVDLNGKRIFSLHYLGTEYGGWAIQTNLLNKDSIIYCFGVGTDISFDEELIKRYDCVVYGFDPTPRSIKWVETTSLHNNYKFIPYGISNFDGDSLFNQPLRDEWVSYSETYNGNENSVYCPVKKITTIMKELNHTHIDLLKMDIEGSEYSVLDDMINNNINPNQLLIEFHGEVYKTNNILDKFKNIYNIYTKKDSKDYYLIKK